jgi:uncharacterized membrane protein YcaP (DUF421 family)
MDVSNIHLSDLQRILVGDAPYAFLLEVIIRTLVIYLVLLIVIRFMGKRMSGQLTIMEMAVMITLGAIISVPAQVPDRGLLQGILLLAMVLAFQRGVTRLTLKSNRLEDAIYGSGSVLIKDGVIQVAQLTSAKVTQAQLFAVLRSQQVYHLGMVKRMYQEATGDFSIYLQQQPAPGLSVLPETDRDALDGRLKKDANMHACTICGHTEQGPLSGLRKTCIVCGNYTWEEVVM